MYESDPSSNSEEDTEVNTFTKNKLLNVPGSKLSAGANASTRNLEDFDVLYETPASARAKGDIISRKLSAYKKMIRGLDIFVTIVSIGTMIISQLENQHYYEKNIDRRVLIVQLADCMKQGCENPDNPNEPFPCSLDCLDEKKFNQVFNKTDFFLSIDFEKNDVNSIPLEFIIDDYSKIMRMIILFLTIATIISIIMSRKIEHTRQYSYFQKKDVSFFKTSLFYLMLCEIFLTALIQYPNIEKVFFYEEFGHYMIFPLSTFLATISLLRVTFVIKLLKSLTRWTDYSSEIVCEKYACSANESFAFKAFQKENPFSVLFAIFIISCIGFGMAIKNFECLYWEHQKDDDTMQWTYSWNAMWFVFVSMTTVGYGDFYPKTQVGRVITIFCCLVGCYFVSSMMVFMTNKTAKNENEEKAFKLITRIQYRKKVINYQSNLIYFAFRIVVLKKEGEGFDDDVSAENEKEINDLKKKMNRRIKDIKQNVKKIQTCDLAPIKEQLFEIHERINTDIKNVKVELNFLEIINQAMKKFTNYQLKSLENIKKNLYSTKLFYDLVAEDRENFPIFHDLKCPLKPQELSFNALASNQKLPLVLDHDKIQTVIEVNESEEEEKDLLNMVKYDEMKITESFSFLFESGIRHTKTNPGRKRTNTKILYKETFDKMKMRKSEKENAPVKNKLLAKYMIGHKNEDDFNIFSDKESSSNLSTIKK